MLDTILHFWRDGGPRRQVRDEEPDMPAKPTEAPEAAPPACIEFAFASIDVGNYA